MDGWYIGPLTNTQHATHNTQHTDRDIESPQKEEADIDGGKGWWWHVMTTWSSPTFGPLITSPPQVCIDFSSLLPMGSGLPENDINHYILKKIVSSTSTRFPNQFNESQTPSSPSQPALFSLIPVNRQLNLYAMQL